MEHGGSREARDAERIELAHGYDAGVSPNDWIALGRLADVVTIAAATLAFFGVLATWLSRPRLTFTVDGTGDSARISFRHARGSSPARNLDVEFAILRPDGVASSGDGGRQWTGWPPNFYPGEFRFITVYDPRSSHMGSEPLPQEKRIVLGRPTGFICVISWQRPMLPWLRTRRVVMWTEEQRSARKSPTLTRGWKASRVLSKAMPFMR